MPSLFLLAGEASGDRIGAALMADIAARRSDIAFEGVGGEAMAAQGIDSLFPIDDLAVMGYRDVILRLPLLLWRARQVVRHILRSKPDGVVLIDAQVFSKVIAKRLRRRGYAGKIMLYVAPAVWAWGPERARTLAELFDEVLSVLPFEPKAIAALGGPATVYVGHPALARFPMRKVQPGRGPLLLLPGSRVSEIRKHLPMLIEIAQSVSSSEAVEGFAILTGHGRAGLLEQMVADAPVAIRVVSDEQERLEMMERAIAAVAVSGTVTLELALSGVPHILTYVAEPAQVRMFEKATSPYIGLPNILAGRALVPEVLFAGHAEPPRLAEATIALLTDPAARETQYRGFVAIRAMMEKGAPEAPLENAADRVLAQL